ncbi:MAG: hypothetical protein WCK65_09055 [Rhodospirillaceae bacterium]
MTSPQDWTSPQNWADWLNVVGSVASMASFGAAGYAAIKVRAIGRDILFNARADEISNEIAAFSNWFSENIEKFPENHHEMDSRVRCCLALIYRVEAMAPLAAQAHVRTLHALETQYFKTNWFDDENKLESRRGDLWNFLTEIDIVLMHIRNSSADRRLGGLNDGL